MNDNHTAELMMRNSQRTDFIKLKSLKECDDVKVLRNIIEALYQTLDDIDTSTDMLSRVSTGDDFNRRFYLLTMKRIQKERNQHLISDGHNLFIRNFGNEVWTCYPFRELGDTPYTLVVPPRKVSVVSHDGDKYATVEYQGKHMELKWGYLSTTEEDAEKLEKNYVTSQWLKDHSIRETVD